MNRKALGITFIIVALLVCGIVFAAKIKEDQQIALLTHETGSCVTSDGVCLHEARDYSLYIFGYILGAGLLLIGIYLFAHTPHASTKESQDKFKTFLKGFSEEEQQVLKAIKEQEGITQSTLRFRTGMAKATLSQMLTTFEKKRIITRKPKGKTNQIFLRKI